MLERFTDAALKVVQLAQQETKNCGHATTGTEHLLLGVLRDDICLPAQILKSMGATFNKTKEEVIRIMGRGKSSELPDFSFSPRAKRVFKNAEKIADERSDPSDAKVEIETRDIVLAMLEIPRCTAQKVMHALDLDMELLATRLRDTRVLMNVSIGDVTTDQLSELHRRIRDGSLSDSDEDDLEDKETDPMLGYIIDRKYEIESVIGRGGMGVVYRVKHLILGRPFAIKVMHPYLASDNRNRRRFQREAQAASRLTHPNLATVFDWDLLEDGRPYLVMYYIEGVKLSELIQNRDSVPLKIWVSIFLQICDALAHAHNEGVIHRDLKPNNVILSRSGESSHFVKIVDFGIAKLLQESAEEAKELTKTGEVFGSPLYMSPEQCLGTHLDVRSDIYSVGCVMYEVITGMPPFLGESLYETMKQHISEPASRLSEAANGMPVPEELESAVMRCLEKSPEARFQSMASLAKILERIQVEL